MDEAARAVEKTPSIEIWEFRAVAKSSLVDYVRRRLARQIRERGGSDQLVERARHVLDPNCLTLGLARRFTAYKRPTLLLRDPDRLARLLLDAQRPAQLIVAGKAHPNDGEGKEMVKAMARFAFRDELRDRVVFLEDYDLALAQQFAAGVDVWINTPRRPAEACGTSGMKMLFNGGLNLSVLDGWWDEAFAPEVGWAIGGRENWQPRNDAADAEQLYQILENQVAPEFYDRDAEGVPQAWVNRVRASMAQLTPQFDAERMVRDYVEKAYLPAAAAYQRRVSEDARIAVALHDWRDQIADGWRGLRFGEMRITHEDERWRFELKVYLGEVGPDVVRVELFADAVGNYPSSRVVMELKGPIPGAVNGHSYTASVVADRPAEHYTVRVVPYHPDAFVPLEDGHVYWQR